MSAILTPTAETLRADIRSNGQAAIAAYRRGDHDASRAYLAREKELIEELRRVEPGADLSKEFTV